MSIRIACLTVLLAAALGVSSCIIPEKFSLHVRVRREGTYSILYVGTIAFAPNRQEWLHAGGSAQLVAADAEVAARLSKEPGCKEVAALGDGRFRVRWEQAGRLMGPIYFPSEQEYLVKLVPQSGHKVKVEGLRLSEGEVQELAKLKVTVDGKLSVDTDGAIVDTNAPCRPWLFGIGSYTWHIGDSGAVAPRLVIEL